MNNNKNTSLSWGEPVAQPTSQIKGKNLAQVEGILTSTIKKKYLPDDSYYWAFFQLEGIESEIPVIFRLKDNSECLDCENAKAVCRSLHGKKKCEECRQPHCDDCPGIRPEITPKSKILLKGNWSVSLIGKRPSFTCLEYQILAPPPKPTIKNLREQISQLLTTSLDKKQEWQQRVDLLFKKKKDLETLEKITSLGSEYLQAYLLFCRAYYSNYQDNLLSYNQFNHEEYLNKLAGEIEDIACQIRAYQSKEKNLF